MQTSHAVRQRLQIKENKKQAKAQIIQAKNPKSQKNLPIKHYNIILDWFSL
jgi:predicted GIY-YIG superfamily endonuclease